MKLSRALLCMDCDEIHEHDSERRYCPSCGSTAPALMLARVLAARPVPPDKVLLVGATAAADCVLNARPG